MHTRASEPRAPRAQCRGYGLSDKPSGVHEYDLDVLAADVAGAVRALGHERCILCGHDW